MIIIYHNIYIYYNIFLEPIILCSVLSLVDLRLFASNLRCQAIPCNLGEWQMWDIGRKEWYTNKAASSAQRSDIRPDVA